MAGTTMTTYQYETLAEVIRAYTQQYGYQDACDAYGEDEVRAAWLPED